MSLYASRRCLDTFGRAAGGTGSLSRTWSSSLVIQHRCYSSPAAAQKTKEKPAVHTSASPSTSRKAQKAHAVAKTPEDEAAEEKAVMDQIDQMERMQHMVDSDMIDMSSAPMQLLDLHIPSWWSKKKGASLGDHWRALVQRQRNWVFNIRSLYRLAKERSIPGRSVRVPWSLQLFRTQSTNSSAWMAPFRNAALESYKEVLEAVAARDDKTIKRLTCGEQQLEYMKLLRSQDPRVTTVWKFHGERRPCKVVSIRALDQYFASQPPRFGNRLAVQALVRFDTLQSVEQYSKKTGARVLQTEPKPVVEYLVFQKRMWYDSPWMIRNRLYEGLESNYTQPSLT